MRSPLLPSSVLLAVLYSSIGLGATAVAADLTLQKVPAITVDQAPAYPENVARQQCGARIESSSQGASHQNANFDSLLSGDPSAGCALPAGRTTLLVSLPKIDNIDQVSWINAGAKGSMTVSISNSKLSLENTHWREVATCELGSDAIRAKVGPAEAKYVKLTFDLSEAGRISSLGVYATPTVAAFTMPLAKTQSSRDRSFGLISYNLTDVHAKARALYVSSGDDLKQANSMLDDQPSTAFSFSVADAAPTAVIDLGKVTTLKRVAAIYSARKGNMDFFVAETLPATQGSNALLLNDATLAKMKSVGKVAGGNGHAAIDFPSTTGRYIILKWTPLTQENTAFSVAEVAAFGGNKEDGLLAANTSNSAENSDGKTVVDSKDLGDGKDIPSEGERSDTPAEGPQSALPPPPPFTFVPELVPTSP